MRTNVTRAKRQTKQAKTNHHVLIDSFGLGSRATALTHRNSTKAKVRGPKSAPPPLKPNFVQRCQMKKLDWKPSECPGTIVTKQLTIPAIAIGQRTPTSAQGLAVEEIVLEQREVNSYPFSNWKKLVSPAARHSAPRVRAQRKGRRVSSIVMMRMMSVSSVTTTARSNTELSKHYEWNSDRLDFYTSHQCDGSTVQSTHVCAVCASAPTAD